MLTYTHKWIANTITIHGNAVIDSARRVVAGKEKHRVLQSYTQTPASSLIRSTRFKRQ